MAFDIESARREGYSDDEIASFLSDSRPDFDVRGALNEGYSLDEIASSFEAPKISGVPPFNPTQESTLPERFISSPALPIVGGTIGGILGASSGPVGAIGGATLGGAGGEAYRQILARKLDLPTPSTSLEAAKEIGIEGATMGAAESLPGIGVAVGRGLLKTPAIGTALRGAGNITKRTLGQAFELLTKIRPKHAETLFKNPSQILPGKMKAARQAWRKAAKEAGLPVDEVSPEIINALKTDAKDTVLGTFEKIQRGEAVSVKEVQIANEALRLAVKPAAVNERNKALVTLYDKIGDVFRDVIGKKSPDLAAANKLYALAKSGEKFKSIFPRNIANESPAYFRSVGLPSVLIGGGLAGGYGRGEPLQGAAIGAGLTALASPLSIGAGIATAGVGRLALPYIRRPIIGALAEYGKDRIR